jgi:hypothetical protein
MFSGVRWLALAGVVSVAALVGPSVALACDGGSSATNIYSEQLCGAGGKGHSTSGKHSAKPSHPSSGSQTTWVAPPVHVSQRTAHAVAHSGKDKKVLNNLVRNRGLVDADHIKPMLVAAPAAATSLGSAFDLGAGPTILFALLLGTVLLVLGTGGVRAWRNRHRV